MVPYQHRSDQTSDKSADAREQTVYHSREGEVEPTRAMHNALAQSSHDCAGYTTFRPFPLPRTRSLRCARHGAQVTPCSRYNVVRQIRTLEKRWFLHNSAPDAIYFVPTLKLYQQSSGLYPARRSCPNVSTLCERSIPNVVTNSFAAKPPASSKS